VCTACGIGDTELTQAQRQAIRQSVDSATRSFAQAEREVDAEKVIAHIAPDFYMYVDGRRVGYDSVVTQIRRTFGSLASFETQFSDVEVIVLGRRGAVVSFTFRDVITDTSGVETTGRGPTTLAWERRDGQWLIVYGDADHYPDSLP
jgi:ketosteroid isomerase-like protein